MNSLILEIKAFIKNLRIRELFLFLFLLLKSLYEWLVETLENVEILGSHLIILIKKIQLATLVSLPSQFLPGFENGKRWQHV